MEASRHSVSSLVSPPRSPWFLRSELWQSSKSMLLGRRHEVELPSRPDIRYSQRTVMVVVAMLRYDGGNRGQIYDEREPCRGRSMDSPAMLLKGKVQADSQWNFVACCGRKAFAIVSADGSGKEGRTLRGQPSRLRLRPKRCAIRVTLLFTMARKSEAQAQPVNHVKSGDSHKYDGCQENEDPEPRT